MSICFSAKPHPSQVAPTEDSGKLIYCTSYIYHPHTHTHIILLDLRPTCKRATAALGTAPGYCKQCAFARELGTVVLDSSVVSYIQ